MVGPRGRLWTPRLQSLRERLSGFLRGWCIDFATNHAGTAERDTVMTAILDCCCCQNNSQTISTLSWANLNPAILTTATMIVIIERHKERLNANFCRASTRILHKSMIGSERTTMSEKMSTAVAIAVSRTTQLMPVVLALISTDDSGAMTTYSVLEIWFQKSISVFLIASMQPRRVALLLEPTTTTYTNLASGRSTCERRRGMLASPGKQHTTIELKLPFYVRRSLELQRGS